MTSLKKIRFNFNIVFLALVLAVLVGAYSVNAVDSSKRVIGYAWSSNIGWVSFSDGTVSVDDSGNMTGYAWSSNIGWVKFGGLSGFPDSSLGGNAKIDAATGNMTGWARVVSVMNPLTYKTIDNRGGWDGWISLSSNGKSPAYGVSVTNNNFSGFAWGSDVIGWLDWSKVKETNPDTLCPSANGLLEEGETTSISTTVDSGADKGKCQTQAYICQSQVLTPVGNPSAPVACNPSADCDARDGIALKNGESHLFYKDRVVVGQSCVSANLTCTDGLLVGADGVADDTYMYSNCLVAPSYTETQ